jgi:hypothetical protein
VWQQAAERRWITLGPIRGDPIAVACCRIDGQKQRQLALVDLVDTHDAREVGDHPRLIVSSEVHLSKYNFLAAITARPAFYLVWHVEYGNFICTC